MPYYDETGLVIGYKNSSATTSTATLVHQL